MPRVKYLNTKIDRIFKAKKDLFHMMCIIVGYCDMKEVKLSDVLGVSDSTARKRREQPEDLTLDQLITCCVKLDIPCEDIKAKINW